MYNDSKGGFVEYKLLLKLRITNVEIVCLVLAGG
jgi:hypothetical protein